MNLKQISFSDNSDSDSEYNHNEAFASNDSNHIDFRLNLDDVKRPQLLLDNIRIPSSQDFSSFSSASSDVVMEGAEAPQAHLRDRVYPSLQLVAPAHEDIDDEANISDFEEEEMNPSQINNGMITSEEQAYAKKNEQPLDFFIMRND